jgi:hypothetical protein
MVAAHVAGHPDQVILHFPPGKRSRSQQQYNPRAQNGRKEEDLMELSFQKKWTIFAKS